jgi:hypothetical protein
MALVDADERLVNRATPRDPLLSAEWLKASDYKPDCRITAADL